ncbi:disease resistance protein RGA3 [Pyrus ussuriensis x Pyrus communis]|uniref:Disease resistance protein RGA3 n=1 Tax=Pyrus ussuriensis x Pyrus communis TaxID=2448454 RepID=A0A5N5G7C3_9ROSA|nr:disease resistance protein RGA3 [Pyrus ussuriensis x Pyrus communis]
MEDLIDCWTTEYQRWKIKQQQVQKFHLPFCAFKFLFLSCELSKLREITSRVDAINRDGRRYESNKTIIGSDKKSFKNIWNWAFRMGGLGKTILAQLVFNDEDVDGYFDFRIWVFVGNEFDMKRIFSEILVSLEQTIDYTPLSLAQLQTRILELLTQKRFLLVLDDLWNHKDEELEPLVKVLNHGAYGSKVLVTSRLKEVSNILDSASPNSLQCLGGQESWWLFKELAFKKDSKIDRELENCGKEIVGMCQGLPLAIKQMAGLLLEDTQILPALRLSYNHLPSPDHKQCFSLCSMFPKSYLYEKDELVKLWMAEGFIQPPKHGMGERTEDIGSRYLKELSDRFFFECSAEDNTKYRMHDLIHDLAQSVSSPFFCQVKDMKDFDEKSRHVSLLQEQLEKPTIEIVNKSKKLRTLLLPVQHLQLRAFGKGQGEIIHSLMHMCVLDMSSSTVVTLPDSIGRLKLLRYLDLSTTETRKLPDSVCNLFNLETLKLLRCPWIFNLPKNLKNLVNLRHLELDEIFWFKTLMLPRSMGCLTGLHTLHKFPGQAATVELKIINCPKLHELPRNYRPEKLEASGCNLMRDLYAHKLNPLFVNCSISISRDHVFGLRFLVISNISNLICLLDWGLPQLRALSVRDCNALEYLSNQNKSFQGFTSLTTFSIHNCPKLVTLPVEGLPTSLKYLSIGSCARLKSFGLADVLQKLDSLHDLYIEDCPALQSLPEGGLPTSLLHLSIQRCPSLIERCGKERGDWPKIEHIPDLEMRMPSTKTATSSSSSSSSAAWYHLCLRRFV